jgi:hypothetical protein
MKDSPLLKGEIIAKIVKIQGKLKKNLLQNQPANFN